MMIEDTARKAANQKWTKQREALVFANVQADVPAFHQHEAGILAASDETLWWCHVKHNALYCSWPGRVAVSFFPIVSVQPLFDQTGSFWWRLSCLRAASGCLFLL